MEAQHVPPVCLQAEALLVLKLHHVLEGGGEGGVQVPVLEEETILIINGKWIHKIISN